MKHFGIYFFSILAFIVMFIKPCKALAYTTYTCNIERIQFVVDSSSGESRVAFKCQAPTPGGIWWFAFRTAENYDKAKMILSILTAAKIAGRTLKVGYESTDTSGNAWGCQADNCRIIMQLIMK